MPHMHSEEHIAFARLHERQRKLEQQHQLAHQHKSYLNSMQRLMGSLGNYLIAIGTKCDGLRGTVNMLFDR
jgi:hypothetical protein